MLGKPTTELAFAKALAQLVGTGHAGVEEDLLPVHRRHLQRAVLLTSGAPEIGAVEELPEIEFSLFTAQVNVATSGPCLRYIEPCM